MNVTPAQRVEQIKLTLQRFRWHHDSGASRHVLVNIADFMLSAYDNGSLKIRMKVCTGERFRGWSIHGQKPMNYETPQLHGDFSYIVLNPTWSVPRSIAVRETYFEALKDPNYLVKRNYRVYRDDTLVNPLSIDWKKYKPNAIPFRFAQAPGEGNALGRMKFVFSNPFDIYLHDTPKRMPFKNAVRAVSHGCVRIEEPMAFVRYLLQGHSKWSVDSVQEYLRQTKAGKTVFLENKIPLDIDYFTAWVDEAGNIQFREDVYGRDKRLQKALTEALKD